MATQTTVPQQDTIANTPADWSAKVTFAQFDPTLGTLQDVRIDIAATVDGTVSIESLDATPASITGGLSGVVGVSTGGTQIAADTVAASGNASLAAYDGVSDYLGNSGTTLAVSQTATTEAVYQPGSVGLAPFIGTGSIDLTASAGIRTDASGAGSLQLQTSASVGAVVSLQYDYVATGDSGGGSESGGSDSLSIIPPLLSVDANAVVSAPQTFTLADRVTGWNANVPVTQFDPALGSLEAVVLTLTDDVTGSLAIQNLETDAARFDATGTATLALSLPGTVTPGVTVAASYDDNASLAGFDGAIDFAGSLVPTVLPATTTVDLSDPDDLAGFIGSGTIDLPIMANGTSSIDAPGDVLERLIGEAGGTVSVSYVYLPTGAESGDGGFLLFGGTDPASVLPTAGPTFAPVAVAQTPPFLLPAATFTPLSAAENAVAATVTMPIGAAGDDDPACFAAGTRIATEDGDVPVEALCVGDRVRCLFGGAASIAWLGQRRIDCRRHPTPDSVWPVRVLAGAFAPGVPQRDLRLSPDHAVYVDGVLIPVKYLINDRTVLREQVDTVVYHHVELPRHDIMFAEGLAAESFLDTGGKADFEGGSRVRLHPDFWSLKWEANGCAPMVVTGPELAAARLRLQVRARDLSRSRSPISRSRAARTSGSSRSRSSAIPEIGRSSAP